ncbi:MAG: S9 family peptidase, partial [Limisphaerales bacterium]
MSVTNEDPNLWLEEVSGERALQWVHAQNAISTNKLESMPGFAALDERLLQIYNSHERIPYVTKHGPFYYNFWRDDKNTRGLWRRTTLEQYRNANPDWETVLDLDKLAETEKENWVWHGYTVLEPSYDRCLIELSRGGADAVVVREFDLNEKKFIPDGFSLPEAKTDVAWRDREALYIGTDFGPGSLTSSGYPRVIKEWRRGTPLTQAGTVFEGQPGDVAVNASVDHDHGHVYEWIRRAPTFFTDETMLRRDNQWVRIEKPDDASVSTFGTYLILRLRSDWTVGGKTFAAGSLLEEELKDYLRGRRDLAVLFEPSERISISATTETKQFNILTELDNVRSRA